MERRATGRPLLAAVAAMFLASSCGQSDAIQLRVELGTRSVSKLPFVIAADQGLFEKYGLDVTLRMPGPQFEGGRRTWSGGRVDRYWRRFLRRFDESAVWHPDIYVDGLVPSLIRRTTSANQPHRIAIGATDCVLRAYIMSRPDIESLDELKGMRIGISAGPETTTGFGALTLAERMGWDPVQDISIIRYGRDVEALRDGRVDAIVASEIRYAMAHQLGFRALADTEDWGVAMAGNSVLIEAGWLDDPVNREAARRFLQATIEGLALFHADRALAIDVLRRWNGIDDAEISAIVYEEGLSLEQIPFPCYDGIANAFALYDSNELRKYVPRDFYDDSLMKELDESGFIASILQAVSERTVRQTGE